VVDALVRSVSISKDPTTGKFLICDLCDNGYAKLLTWTRFRQYPLVDTDADIVLRCNLETGTEIIVSVRQEKLAKNLTLALI
jgi:hypothetical protein